MLTSLRNILTFLFICCAQLLLAQNISVSSFKLLENDLTANTTGTMERDQNGEVAALIKVVTTEQGFVFDGGMSGIVKTKQSVGEVWVYVPHGIKKITIQHAQLGVLRDYFFPITVEKAKTYEMRLTTGKVETIVTHAINKQFLVFEVTPPNATIELNDEPLSVDEEGHSEKNVPFGKYEYRISAHNYHTEAGMVEVNNPTTKHVVKVNLRPNFGWLQVPESDDLSGADIYINNEKIGKAPLKSDALKSGKYKLKIVKPLYRVYEGDIEIQDNQIVEANVKLIPNFAPTTLVATDGAEIFVDGQRKGVGTWTGPLEKGSYTVEVRKEGHRSSSIVVHVTTSEERSIQLPTPIPILSSVEITSTPSNATVTMDGKELGTTPLLLPNILVGKHDLSFSKKNYQTITQTVEVKENETAKLHVELSGECIIKVTTTPPEAQVAIDGSYVGNAPFESNLYAGAHTFKIAKAGYNSIEKVIVIDGSQDVLNFTLKRRYQHSNATYLEAGISVLNMPNVSGTFGLFANNFNIELSYAYGLQTSEPIYWNGQSTFYETHYSPTSVQGKVGYGIICGNRVRVTPQVGCSVTKLAESKVLVGNSYEESNSTQILEGSNMVGGTFSLRFDVALFPNIGINITPQYTLPIWSSTWATTLKSMAPVIDSWSKGVSVKVGFTIF